MWDVWMSLGMDMLQQRGYFGGAKMGDLVWGQLEICMLQQCAPPGSAQMWDAVVGGVNRDRHTVL